MSEYRIKGETLTGIADAIRSKTGGTEPIPVPEMAAQIEGITGGGGSSADVCYVTFMSHDGTVKLGRKAVAVRDDCADPIARGVFDTPTRESDAQYNYAFAGWSKNPDNVLDDTALDAVTEDRVVYAVYAATVRCYTISYYDGDTPLKSETLAYGTMPSYEPEKDGVIFEGWEPALAMVTGDASYTAVWGTKKALNDYTWEELAAMPVEEVRANFAVGDLKIVADSTILTKVMCAKLVGIEHDDLSDGSGKATMSFISYYMANTQCSYGSNLYWNESTQLSKVQSDCANGYPAQWGAEDVPQLANVVESVKKEYVNAVTDDGYTTDFLDCTYWVPSMTEIGYVYDGIPTEGAKYDAYTVKTALGAQTEFGATCGVRTTSSTNANKTYITNASKSFWGPTKDYNSSAKPIIGFCIGRVPKET